MENLRNTNSYDFDDYFMQKINSVYFSGGDLRIKIQDRPDLNFSGVELNVVGLKIFDDNDKNKTLYSLYINSNDKILEVELKVLCDKNLYDVFFTALEMF